VEEKIMNPIFAEYYSHEECDCYKIKLPWSEYSEEKMVLCKVSEGIEYAKLIATGVIVRHLLEVTKK
jgi:hypothetical protein